MYKIDLYVWQYIEILSKRYKEWTVMDSDPWSKWSSFQAADEPLLPPQLLPDVPESLKSIENQLQSEKKCIELGVSADQSIWIWKCVETLRQSQTRHQTRNGRGLSRNINHTLFRDGTFVEF